MERLGLEVEFVDGLRVSDAETVEVAKMVLVGKLNKDIVLRLNRHGQPAVGLCGDDGSLFRVARRRPRRGGEDLGFVGRDRARRRGRAATTSPRTTSRSSRPSAPTARATRTTSTPTRRPARSPRALGAYKVIFLTDVEGWLRDPADPASRDLRGRRRRGDAPRCGDVAGGMRPKLAGLRRRDRGRRQLAHIVDGRVPHSLLLELFTDAGIGTKISEPAA